jgi:hypothetical protein
MRDLTTDLQRLKEHFGVSSLVCLLNDAELRSLGVRRTCSLCADTARVYHLHRACVAS